MDTLELWVCLMKQINNVSCKWTSKYAVTSVQGGSGFMYSSSVV